MTGVIGISRGIWSDPDFKAEPFTEREAFMWMLSEAAWKDRRARGARGPVYLKRGEFCHSVRFMAEAWKWPKSRVSRFLLRLKNRDTIRDSNRDGEQIYFISNYNKYQVAGLPERDSDRDTDRDCSGTAAGQQRDKLEEGKKGRRENNNTPATPRAELETVLDIDRAAAVVEHRQRLGKPLTVRAAKLLANELRKCPDPNAGADEMLARGWQGFKAEWMKPHRASATGPPAKGNWIEESLNSIPDEKPNERSSPYDNGAVIDGETKCAPFSPV